MKGKYVLVAGLAFACSCQQQQQMKDKKTDDPNFQQRREEMQQKSQQKSGCCEAEKAAEPAGQTAESVEVKVEKTES